MVENQNNSLKISSLFWLINNDCNARCPHCICHDYNEKNVFSIFHTEQILHKIKIYNIKEIYVTGGEPLLDKDIEKKLKLMRTILKGCKIFLCTNGKFLTEDIVRLCINLNIKILLSILASQKSTHQKMFAVPDFWTINSLNILKEIKQDLICEAVTIITRNNVDDLYEIGNLIKNYAYIDTWYLCEPFRKYPEYNLDKEYYTHIEDLIYVLRNNIQGMEIIYDSLESRKCTFNNLQRAVLTNNGSLYLCLGHLGIQKVNGESKHILDTDLHEIYKEILRNKAYIKEACQQACGKHIL